MFSPLFFTFTNDFQYLHEELMNKLYRLYSNKILKVDSKVVIKY